MNGDQTDEVILFTDTRAYIYGSSDIDITDSVPGIPAPRPQLKKHYCFTRYWGGEYLKTLPNSIDHIVKKDILSVYPNPVHEILNFSISGVIENGLIEIYNQQGKLVLDRKIDNSEYSINIQHLKSGYYILKVKSRYLVTVRGFVKL